MALSAENFAASPFSSTTTFISKQAKSESAFDEFHASNPEVYAELVKLARQVKTAGFKKFGIRMIWERMRWSFTVEQVKRVDGDEYKFNDHYTPFYARLIMAQEPDLCGLFEVRTRQ